MRRESSTVVVLVGEMPEALLTDVARSPNIALVRPPDEEHDSLPAAVAALGQASHRAAPFVLVPADPLAEVAAQWQAMWDLSAGPHGPAAFEERAAVALSAWRAGRFELPDYYLALAPATAGAAGPRAGAAGPRAGAAGPRAGGAGPAAAAGPPTAAGLPAAAGPDFYLGPLRAARPRRVEAVVTTGEDGDASRVRQALRSLPHGPWWPPLDELIDTARRFFAGGLAEGAGSLASPTLSPLSKPAR
jgi:hypothetical protein